MKYIIFYAHPNPKSFCRAIREEIQAQIKAQGAECVVRDLYEMNFSPLLSANDFTQFAQQKTPQDIQKEQELIRAAETLIFIHPIWWFNMPAILRGYIDRVFSRGFAYDYVNGEIKGLLTGKKVCIVNTTGGPKEAYEQFGYHNAIKISVDNGIFEFCGMKVILHKYFHAVPTITDAARKEMLNEIKNIKF